MSFVSELKRRKVFQVAAVYLVVAWLIMQVVDVVNDPLLLPDWFARVVILLLAVGFPIAVILSWAFDLTPEGVVKDQGSSVVIQSSGRRMEYVFAGLLVVALGTLLYREFSPSEQVVEVVAEQSEQERLPNSVAVLPFTNLSSDPEDAFFAAGIHDTVLHELAKIRALNVIGRTSVLQYADGQTPISEIAETLNVETVLEATVQYADDQVRITAQLIDPDTGAHLWSGNYDRPFKDIFEIQSEIATRIAMALEAELLPSEQESIEKAPTNSPEAYAVYLKAMELVPGFEDAGLGYRAAAVVTLLNEATDFDPEFALAYAHKARLDNLDIEFRRESVQRALTLDPDLGFGYLVLGNLHVDDGAAPEARAAFERALQLSPNDPDVLIQYAQFRWMVGEAEDADVLAARVLELDPNNWGAHYSLGFIPRLSRNSAAAADAFRTATELNPTNMAPRIELALEEANLGNFSEAVAQLRIAEQLEPKEHAFVNARLAYGYSRAGRTEDAKRLFDEYQRALPAYCRTIVCVSGDLETIVVWAYLAIGDDQQALEAIQQLTETQNGLSLWAHELRVNAWNDPILDQPEFVEVRSRLGFRE